MNQNTEIFVGIDAAKLRNAVAIADHGPDGADSDEFGHLLRSEFVRGRVSFRRMTIAYGFGRGQAAARWRFVRRKLSPVSAMRWALCTRRSRMASA